MGKASLTVGLDGLEDVDGGVTVLYLAGVVVAAGLDHGGEGGGGGGGDAWCFMRERGWVRFGFRIGGSKGREGKDTYGWWA